jgi:hypothetical protein
MSLSFWLKISPKMDYAYLPFFPLIFKADRRFDRINISLGGLFRSVYGGHVPRTQRSAPFFMAWCAAEPGS